MNTNDNSLDNKTINHIILPYLSHKQNEVTILFNESIDDEREGANILTIVTFSDKAFIVNKGSALTVNSQTALDAIKVDLPDYDFGHPVNQTATSYRWNENDQWGVTLVETTNGYYSRWQRITNN